MLESPVLLDSLPVSSRVLSSPSSDTSSESAESAAFSRADGFIEFGEVFDEGAAPSGEPPDFLRLRRRFFLAPSVPADDPAPLPSGVFAGEIAPVFATVFAPVFAPPGAALVRGASVREDLLSGLIAPSFSRYRSCLANLALRSVVSSARAWPRSA